MSFRSLLNEKFREALRSTLPIVGIVLLLLLIPLTKGLK